MGKNLYWLKRIAKFIRHHPVSSNPIISACFKLLIWGLIILAIIALVKWLSGKSLGAGPAEKTATQILQERYARGEIDKGEYEQKKADLDWKPALKRRSTRVTEALKTEGFGILTEIDIQAACNLLQS